MFARGAGGSDSDRRHAEQRDDRGRAARDGTGGISTSLGGVQIRSQAPRISQRDAFTRVSVASATALRRLQSRWFAWCAG